MGKDTKGKGKTRAKKVKGGKRAAEKQEATSNESTDSSSAPVFRAVGIAFSFSSSLPPDSDEESCPQTALAFTLIFKVLAPRIFAGSGSSGDAEIVEGFWPNQEPLSLSARLFFFLWQNGDISFFFGPVFFFFSLPKDFFLLLFFPYELLELPRGNFVKYVM